jgi:hypothetical protein
MFRTKYTGPTDTHGPRITATGTLNGRKRQKTIPFDYALGGLLDSTPAHLAAVVALVEHTGNGWTRSQVDNIDRIVVGDAPSGYTFDFIER